jgi:hypothetical protein
MSAARLFNRRYIAAAAVSACYAAVLFTPVLASADITTGLVGWWKMDEGTSTTAHDSSGYGSNGTVCTFTPGSDTCTGATSAGWVTGKFGSAFASTAAQQRKVWVKSASPALNATTTGTVAAWVKLNSYPGWMDFVCKEDNGSGAANGYALRSDNSSPPHFAGDTAGAPGNGNNVTSTHTLPLNKWVHIAYTWYWDGAHIQMLAYYNGALDAGPTQGYLPTPQSSTFYVGICQNDSYDWVDGSIDDVRVYNRALSASDMGQLYNETQSYIRKPRNNLGLVAYWTFDEGASTTAHDSSGNGYTATLYSGGSTLPKWVSGKFGNALSFDGNTNYAAVSLPTSRFASAMTVSAWFKPAVSFSKMQYAYPNILGGDASAWGLYVDGSDNSVNFYLDDSGSVRHETATSPQTPAAVGQWSHVVGTYDGTNQKLYVNGVLYTPTSWSGTILSNTTASIGRGDGNNAAFQGAIDDVRIYNRALSQAEVTNLYQTGGSAKVASAAEIAPGSSLQQGLVGYWTFDGKDTPWSSATAGSVIDRSGQGNNGTITGGTRTGSPVIGKMGQALHFDGSSYIHVSTTNGLTTGGHPWTLAAWVKAEAADMDPTGQHPIVTYDSVSGVNFATPLLSIESQNWLVSTWGSDCYDGNRVPVPGKWMHVVGVFDGVSTITTYINGTYDTSCGSKSSNPGLGSGGPQIGELSGSGMSRFYGILDDVRIYNRALSDKEIMQLYKLGKTTLRP